MKENKGRDKLTNVGLPIPMWARVRPASVGLGLMSYRDVFPAAPAVCLFIFNRALLSLALSISALGPCPPPHPPHAQKEVSVIRYREERTTAH